MRQRSQQLNADNLQEVLDAARNASQKGTQQFLTPPDIAAALALPLPRSRQTIVDLQSGAGALLTAAANHSTENLLGIDIDPRSKIIIRKAGNQETNGELISPASASNNPQSAFRTPQLRSSVITGDLTSVYPLLAEINWRADLILLNPPFSLKWHRDKLTELASSDCDAVAETFDSLKLARGNVIDSTLATLLIAIDRLTSRGEGYMICNESTARRFFGDPDSDSIRNPHSAIRNHLWLWLTVPNFFENVGNRLGGLDQAQMKLAVLYFARHRQPQTRHLTATEASAESIKAALAIAITERSNRAAAGAAWRNGPDVCADHYAEHDTPTLFSVAKHEWQRLTRHRSLVTRHSEYNIWLDQRGLIRRYLTAFQNLSCKVSRQDAKDLDDLDGQSPMALVVQKASRLTLMRAVKGSGRNGESPWRVDPALTIAVDKALSDYESVRAPFYPLNEVQRLGYLDEEDSILCRKNFGKSCSCSCSCSCSTTFQAGKRYALKSRTVPVQRDEKRISLTGREEDIEVTGQELSIEICSAAQPSTLNPQHSSWHAFTHDPKNSDMASKEGGTVISVHDLQTLIEHFEIPPVPDIASMRPEEYHANIAKLHEIEEALAAA